MVVEKALADRKEIGQTEIVKVLKKRLRLPAVQSRLVIAEIFEFLRTEINRGSVVKIPRF